MVTTFDEVKNLMPDINYLYNLQYFLRIEIYRLIIQEKRRVLYTKNLPSL